MNHFIPAEPCGFTPAMIERLPRQTEEPLEQIIGYYCYLETVAYKLVHYKGFCFGDRFLKMVVPEYVTDTTVTSMYRRRLDAIL